ncbi:MAG: COQ9 family protein [Pikeienuella sp.]
MTDKKTESDHLAETLAKLLTAALPHAPFDGWSAETFNAAVTDSGVALDLAKSAAPRGSIDLAVAYHRQGDAAMVAALQAADLSSMRFRDRITFAVRTRIQDADREIVRRGITLFALPIHAAEGAKLLWGTADTIWSTLGDTSRDYNWYSKRTILSGVYSATLLYWLGDESEDASATWEFLDRRIEGVMQFEKVKADLRSNKLASTLLAGPKSLLSHITAPGERGSAGTRLPVGLPGHRSK